MSIMAWLKGLTRRRLDDDDLQEEIRAHLAIAAAERMADGADPKTARQASLKEFGNVKLAREAARRVWTPRWLDALRDQLDDIRYAIRALAKNPAAHCRAANSQKRCAPSASTRHKPMLASDAAAARGQETDRTQRPANNELMPEVTVSTDDINPT